jgi:hypothetical protein
MEALYDLKQAFRGTLCINFTAPLSFALIISNALNAEGSTMHGEDTVSTEGITEIHKTGCQQSTEGTEGLAQGVRLPH